MGGLKFAVLQDIKTRAAKPSVLGKVSFIEALRDVPFEIGRVYYSYGVESGLRGIMGAGTNRMNVNVVKWVSQGVFKLYEKKRSSQKEVADRKSVV